MPQHNNNLVDQGAAEFRTDLNDNLVASASGNSGRSAPPVIFGNQIWCDTAAGLVKRRNSANTAWIIIGPLSGVYPGNTVRGRLTEDGIMQDISIADLSAALDVNRAASATQTGGVELATNEEAVLNTSAVKIPNAAQVSNMVNSLSQVSGYVRMRTFTATGEDTWTKPSGVRFIEVVCTGAGGSGAAWRNAISSGGAAGGTAIKTIDVSNISSVVVRVGVGGAGVNLNNSVGIAGTNSSFGSYCTGKGGGPGYHNGVSVGGDAIGGDVDNDGINIFGGSGSSGWGHSARNGGASYWGGGGNYGRDAKCYGAGGGGTETTSSGAGANGIIIVREYK